MKALIKNRRNFAIFLIFCVLAYCLPVTAQTNSPIQTIENNNIESAVALNGKNLPENIQKLLPQNSEDYTVFLAESGKTAREHSVADLYTLHKKAIQVKNGSANNAVSIVQYTDNGTSTQKWYLERVVSNACSRAVTTMPVTENYEKRVEESASRYGQMSDVEYANNYLLLQSAITLAKDVAKDAREDYPVASAMLLHFFDNTGTEYVLNSNFIKNSADIDAKRQEIFDKLDGAYDTLKVPNITTVYGRVRVDTYDGDAQTEDTDWKLSVNSCELWGKTTAIGTTSKQTTLYVRDFYDWKAGEMSTLFNVAADILNQCHYAGIARDYPVTGCATY